jgi:hypothetical protein
VRATAGSPSTSDPARAGAPEDLGTPPRTDDPGWWEGVLGLPSGAVRDIRSRDDERSRGMTSTLERIRLALHDGTDRFLVVKRSAQAFRGMGLALPQWRTERDFYREVAPRVSLPTPRCWYAVATDDGTGGMLVLDDLSPDGTNLARPARDAVRTVIAQLSALERESRPLRTPLPVRGYLFADRIDAVWRDLRGAVAEHEEPFAVFLDEVYAAFPALLGWAAARDASVVHGDLAAANAIPLADGRIGIIDFGTATVGMPAVDVSRIAAECADIADDPDAHRETVAEWHALTASDRTADDAWDEYRAGLALNAQYAMFLHLNPWPEGPRRDAAIRSARLLEASLRVCEVPAFLRTLR